MDHRRWNSSGLPIASTRRNVLAGLAGIGGMAALPPLPAKASLAHFPDRLRDFKAYKFGMFIHWGPYTQKSLEASWAIMIDKWKNKFKVSDQEYFDLAKTFNPKKYDPDIFIDAARSAGQRYMVFTSKHHDGFCMFDSKVSDYKITKSPYGKDIVKMLADACARRDMPLGLYYSPPDLHHPFYRDQSLPASLNYKGQRDRPEWPKFQAYVEAQLNELLTGYGELFCLWFDAFHGDYSGPKLVEMVNRLQPRAIINDRIRAGAEYLTPEHFFPDGVPARDPAGGSLGNLKKRQWKPEFVPSLADFEPWETCMTINGKLWSYSATDRAIRSSIELIQTLSKVAARGGNLLLNIGPGPAFNILVN